MAKLSILAELIGAENVARGVAQITEALQKMHDAAAPREGESAGGAIEAMAGGITDVVVGFAKGAAAAAAATISIDALISSVKFGIVQWGELERAQNRVNAVFEATRHAAGVTTSEIIALSNELSRTTFVTQNAVLQGAASLATFRSVHGEAFEEILRLSQDVAEVMGRDFNTTVIQMGRAMESVASGSAEGLRRSFNFLSPAILETVKRMTEAGDRVKAMDYLMEEVRKTLGGAGEAAHGGTAGAMDTFKKSVDDVWTALGRFLAEGTALPQRLQEIAAGINAVSDAIINSNEFQLSQQNEDLKKLWAQRNDILSLTQDEIQRRGGGRAALGGPEAVEKYRQTALAAVDKQIAQLEAQRSKTQALIDVEKEKAAAGEQQAAAQQKTIANNERINALLDEQDKETKALIATIKSDLLTPQEKYNEQIRLASNAYLDGAIGLDEYNAVMAKYKKELKDAEDALKGVNNEQEKAIQLNAEQMDRIGDLMPMVGGMMEEWEDYRESLQKFVDEGLKDARTPMEEFVDGLNKINEAVAAGINITPQQREKLIRGLVDDYNAAAEGAKELTEAEAYLLATTQSAMDGFAEAITSNLTTAGDAWDAFKNVVLDVGKQILDMILKLSVINPLLNSVFGTSYTTLGSIFGGGTGVYAGSSAAFYAGGPAVPGGLAGMFATGGEKVVTRPSLIAVGEMGPEHISVTPLAGGRRGGGGGTPSIYIDARNSNGDQAVEAAVREGLRRAMPGFVEAAAQSVRMRYRMDPGYLR